MTSTTTERPGWNAASGYGLLVLSEIAGLVAVLTLPLWLLHLLSPAARPGSAIMVGPAVIAVAVAATQLLRSRLRAVITLIALAVAGTAAAAVWPPPALTWAAALAGSTILRYSTRQLIEPPPAGRLGAGTMLLTFLGVIGVGHVVPRTGSGAWSPSLVGTITLQMAIVLMGASGLAVLIGSRRSPTLRLEERWEQWRLRQLARDGLRPLDPAAAPVLWRRVEATGERVWTWEVRDHQTTVDSGSQKSRARAERSASRACFDYTFRPPIARRPGALYVLAPVNGNPFVRRVVDINGAASRTGAEVP